MYIKTGSEGLGRKNSRDGLNEW
jgi:hypothetical protein